MPMYCYKDQYGNTMEQMFPMGEAPEIITIDERFYERDYSAEHHAVPATTGWPIECYASGVNAADADKLRKHFKEIGVPTEVSKDGNPIYRDARHRRKALKARGFMDKSAYL